eukprot:CAMPEP_0176291910 /NCGR_PEP_ID=MMETSP0121_2-20121125/55800_1 /TAXON_ID=160619 /ORGANISM="Kryptoperidinium foliaceum, Strain CCMP 1326" /LENGTH=46 /DNA_ID= /DNA_START= /DNA_END= /DNA_ORIENTATION=
MTTVYPLASDGDPNDAGKYAVSPVILRQKGCLRPARKHEQAGRRQT